MTARLLRLLRDCGAFSILKVKHGEGRGGTATLRFLWFLIEQFVHSSNRPTVAALLLDGLMLDQFFLMLLKQLPVCLHGFVDLKLTQGGNRHVVSCRSHLKF